mmetsp:Transcript_44267/g.73731  ORF Transcript_44267/g.73731 Transcript_44267/m.73731 type:complete len:268 (-) Transcript_44267:75-878(-)|eukprot:CAMPEP_0198230432 /NCGR_PEP_ID=MMETSP1445-20131203/114485_1 /TAXON_ID=36898 /ORGANISM="Pyramimonas sp., Strain CCMP2087" /LENGTH=267 /DNA_ID=CAMNT_0043910971 /DNA_START=446 /DNA_END=1249 /DNA_ORIENTATION=-
MEIPVKLAVSVNAHSATKIFQEVVKFVLYFQNQCPGPYDQMLDTVKMLEEEEEEHVTNSTLVGRRKRRRTTAGDRRLRKFVRDVEALFELVDAQFLVTSKGTDMLVVLGASPARPKMACLLQWCPNQAALHLPPSEVDDAVLLKKQASDGARRVIRALIQSALDTKIATGPSKLFVLSRGPVVDTPPPHFLPKRSFQPQWRKGKQIIRPICIKLHNSRAAAAGPVSEEAGAEGEAVGNEHMSSGESIWYQSSVSVRGLSVSTPDAAL